MKEVTQTKTESTQTKTELKRVMKEMANRFIDTKLDDIPPEEWARSLRHYLEGALELKTTQASVGCLRITVECRTLEILEHLWDDYCSGHLNEVVEERLLTDEIKMRFRVESVKLTTTILQEDYLACKQFLEERNQDSTTNMEEGCAQGLRTQAIDETRSQYPKTDPLTLPSAVNYTPEPKLKRKSSPATSKEVQEGLLPPKRRIKSPSSGSTQRPEQSTPTTMHDEGTKPSQMLETGSPTQGPSKKGTIGPPEVSVTLLKNKNLPSKATAWHKVQLPIDFLLLTVKDCEFLSCLSYLNEGFFKSYHKSLGYLYFGDIGDGETMTSKIAVIKCNTGSTVPKGSVLVVTKAVKILRPKAVFCVGFCGGLNYRKVKLGDVVVSARLTTYAPIKITDSGVRERGVHVPIPTQLADLIRSAGEGWEAPLKDPGQLEVEVHRDGEFLSGPEVVDSKERRDQLINRFPDAIAIEMEGEGLYTAAHDLDVEWIVIKGVSDFADGRKSETDSWRPFASLMAASLTAHMLSDSAVFKDWPHYGRASTRRKRTISSLSSTEDLDEPTTAHHGGVPPPKKKKSLSGGSAQVPDRPTTVHAEVKAGKVSDDDLELLSLKLADKWDKLARHLKFDRARITAYHKENEKWEEKAYNMLMDWKQREGRGGTYQVLYDAMCRIELADLADDICCVQP